MRQRRVGRSDWTRGLSLNAVWLCYGLFALKSLPFSAALPVATHSEGGTQRALQQLRWAIWKIKPLPVSDQEN